MSGEDLAKIGGALVTFGGIAWAVIKILVARAVSSIDGAIEQNAADLKETKREWKTELSGVKSAMEVKESEAREGREKLHDKVDQLDLKVQTQYARKDAMDDLKAYMVRIEKKLDTALANR